MKILSAAVLFCLTIPAALRAENLDPPAQTRSTSAITLADCYQLALKQSEKLLAQSEKIEQLNQRYQTALGAALPRFSFNAAEFFQDSGGRSDPGAGSNLTRTERPELKFVIRQPLFSGFREFSAMASLKQERESEQYTLYRASKLLFLDVSRSFYLAVQIETELKNLTTLYDLTQERVRELKERERLGKSRRSEVLAMESQLEGIEAQRTLVQQDYLLAVQLLSFLTGKELDQPELADTLPEPAPPDPVEKLLSRSQDRSDLLALRKKADSLRQQVRLTRGSFYPSASLLGNYYAKRVGTQQNIDWDILLSLDIPLYQGGTARSQLRESLSRLHESEILLRQREREIRLEIRNAALRLASSLDRLKQLRRSYDKASESYQLQVREYRASLVNNLEVIQSLNTMQDRKRELDRALIQNKLNWLELQTALENVPKLQTSPQKGPQ